jgi:hypothetical protein
VYSSRFGEAKRDTEHASSDVDQRIYFTPWRDTGLRRVMG